MLEEKKGDPIRVAYITQWFTPEPAGPADWIADSLLNDGFAVRTITAIPNYPAGVVYQGYRASRVTREIIRNIPTLRCPVYPSHNQSAPSRALNYLSFAATSSWVGQRVLASSDVALIYSSPATAAIPAMIAKRRSKLPYVLLIQDLWPDTVLQTEMLGSKKLRKLAEIILGKLDKSSTSGASHIIVISPGVKKALTSRGVPEYKITVMYNWINESILHPCERRGDLRRRLSIPPGDFVFMYAGNHGAAQGLHAWIAAIENVQDLTNLHFVFVGNGTEKIQLVERVQSLNLRRVHFLESVEVDEFAVLAADTDAQIISLKDAPLFRITIPSKVQSSLAIQSAVIASVAGDAASVLEDSGAGILASPEDQFSIESAIRQAHTEGVDRLKQRGLAGRRYYLDHMSQDRGSATLSRTLRECVRIDSGGKGE